MILIRNDEAEDGLTDKDTRNYSKYTMIIFKIIGQLLCILSKRLSRHQRMFSDAGEYGHLLTRTVAHRTVAHLDTCSPSK